MYYSSTLREFISRPTAAAGNYAYVTDLDVRHDISVAPGGVLSLTSKLLALLSSSCWQRLGDATVSLGLAKIFLFSAWIADGRPAYLLLLLPLYVIHSHYLSGSSPSSLPSSIVVIIAIVIVDPQFKRNIYLSLLCDWIFLYLQNHFYFLLPKCAELKYVISLYFRIFVLCIGMWS